MERSVRLRDLDLNLLVALDALLREAHVSRAAARLEMSQSSMSLALSKLRAMFNDPLLVKGGSGLVLTARASELAPKVEEALRQIRDLYKVEAEIHGRSAEERRVIRQERSRPIVEALHTWLTAQLERVSGKSNLGEAIRYALRHWTGLVLFLEDGRLELDTNTIERAIRPIALGRKNALFAGSDGGARHWAIVASLVATAKLNGVEPLAWLTDVLERMVSGRTKAH